MTTLTLSPKHSYLNFEKPVLFLSSRLCYFYNGGYFYISFLYLLLYLVYFYISPLGIFIKDTFSYIATQPLSSFPGASEIQVYRLFHEYVFICTFLHLFLKSIWGKHESEEGALWNPRGVGMEWEMGGRFKREGIYAGLWRIHEDGWQKPAQYCKVIILQLKKKNNLMQV